MSFGSGPYGVGSLGVPGLEPEPETVASLSSSRAIDFVTRRYVTDADGGFEAMDDVAQRVMLLIAYGVPEPKIITPQDNADVAARTRSVLEVLTKGPQPTIEIQDLRVDDAGGGRTFKSLTYKNLLTGTRSTLHADGTIEVH